MQYNTTLPPTTKFSLTSQAPHHQTIHMVKLINKQSHVLECNFGNYAIVPKLYSNPCDYLY